MGKYIFAPILHNNSSSAILIKCIEYIGSLQNAHGSNLAKGIRYLKASSGCSGASIKYLYKSTKKFVGHDFDVYGPDIYKYDDRNVTQILKIVISFIESHSNDVTKSAIFGEIQRPILYTKLIYDGQIKSLSWIAVHNYKDQQERAHILVDTIRQIPDELR